MKTYQTLFHEEWAHLKDKHVRALAWLLTSPDLLENDSGVWWNQIGTLDIQNLKKLRSWLSALDVRPTPLHESLKLHEFTRLGHYAENLLAYYFAHEGLLYGHGIQVHTDKGETVGEFDFLLFAEGRLLHIELATKFYLYFHPTDPTKHASPFDYLGPNLNDTLGLKMRKILKSQLSLSYHEAARKIVQDRVIAAKALIKGWMFYRQSDRDHLTVPGLNPHHCLGFWWTQSEFEKLAIPFGLKLDRLEWLAPAQASEEEVMDKGMLLATVERHFLHDTTPVLVAIMKKNGDLVQEFCRGMVVPNDWPERAAEARS